MQSILFRADSSSTIGTGHIMRDLVLAEQFRDANITFATQDLDGNINHKIKEKQYPIEILSSNDFQELNDLIKKLAIDMIVIDHYEIDYNFEKKLKENHPNLKIFVFDDTYERHYCDILLNHNISADPKKYKELVPEQCELRCGAEYTLLREEFILEKQRGRQNQNNPDRLNVFIAMGGADHSNLNIKILEVLKTFPNLHAHVVTTTANKHLEELKEYVFGKNNTTLHVNTDTIAQLMNQADFAIVTPSVTVNEIVHLNVPFIAIKTANNQNDMFEYLSRKSYPALKTFDVQKLLQKIEEIFYPQIELVNFTELSLDDKKMILSWRNHPNIRQWMFHDKCIELEDHLNYIDSLSTRDDKKYFLIKRASSSIGVIDFTNIDYQNRSSEFGLYANPELKGVGNHLMEAVIDYGFKTLCLKKLIAEVFEENKTAIKLYKRYKFKEIKSKHINNRNVIQLELDNENR